MAKRKKSFVSSAIILMIAGLVVRLFGFVYRVYLSNLIGSEGIGLFQLISPVYSLIILTLTSGISIAVSRLVAHEAARGHNVNIRRITLSGLMVVVAAGIVVSLLILFNINFIVNSVLKDSRTYSSMIFLIPCIPVIATASVLKGYFYGMQEVTPTALSQIAEQVMRISLVFFISKRFQGMGLEFACAMATAAIAIGEITNLLVLFIMYKPSIKKVTKNRSKKGLMRKRRIMWEISKIAVPVSSNRLITSLMSAVELILIPRRLLTGGMDYQTSIELYGKLTGMAMPLVFFPSIFTSSLSTTLVPAISEALSLKNLKTLNYRISKSIQMTFILGFLFTAIFMVYPNEISNSIFTKANVGELLYLLSFTCLFFYLQQTLLGILNGLGKEATILSNSIISYAIRIVFVYFLLPLYGIKSYIIAIIISSVFVCLCNLAVVMKTTGMSIDLRNWIIKPGMVCMIMIFIGKYIYSFFTLFMEHELFIAAFSVAANFAIGLILMTVTGVVSYREVLKMLGLEKLPFAINIGQKLKLTNPKIRN
ncbi:MAG TPA: stage V sporulation protein B [Clostridiales bacterium]|nr:stage V sporulation protein B [Clostridiales bacterium]